MAEKPARPCQNKSAGTSKGGVRERRAQPPGGTAAVPYEILMGADSAAPTTAILFRGAGEWEAWESLFPGDPKSAGNRAQTNEIQLPTRLRARGHHRDSIEDEILSEFRYVPVGAWRNGEQHGTCFSGTILRTDLGRLHRRDVGGKLCLLFGGDSVFCLYQSSPSQNRLLIPLLKSA